MLDWITQQLVALIATYPGVAMFFMVMGILRSVMKPTISYITMLVNSTPSIRDNEIWAKIQASPTFSTIVYLIDWWGSIKLPVTKSLPPEKTAVVK